MSTFDAEDLVDSILDLMVTDNALNVKIAAIDAEKAAKGKELAKPLAEIGEDCYHLQTWSDKILRKTPAIFYGIEETQTQDGGGISAGTYKIFVEVCLLDNGQLNDANRRINRYARALKELFQEKFADVQGHGKIKIDTVRPIAFKLELDSDDELKVGGVSLTISLA